jgi:hypothetical protein
MTPQGVSPQVEVRRMEQEQKQQVDYSFTVLREGEWLLEYDIEKQQIFAARIVEASCPKCGVNRVALIRYSDEPIPRSAPICPKARVAVSGRAYKSQSGLSYTKPMFAEINLDDPSVHGKKYWFITEFQDLQILDLPKVAIDLIDLASIPNNAWIYHWDSLRIVYTEFPIYRNDFYHRVQSLCWNCCREIIQNASETARQGNLVLAKVNSRELEAVQEKIINRADQWDKRFFNHKFELEGEKVLAIFRNFCSLDYCAFLDSSDSIITVTAEDHPSITVPKAYWVGYHPDPKEAD